MFNRLQFMIFTLVIGCAKKVSPRHYALHNAVEWNSGDIHGFKQGFTAGYNKGWINGRDMEHRTFTHNK